MNLENDTCGICGNYCLGSPPYPWKFINTKQGRIQACYGCFEVYSESKVENPRRHFRESQLHAKLASLQARQNDIEAELDEIE